MLYLNFEEGNHFFLRITFILIPFCEPLFCFKIFAFPVFDLSFFFSNSYSMIAGDTVIVPGTLEEPTLGGGEKEEFRLKLLWKYYNYRGNTFFIRVRKLNTKYRLRTHHMSLPLKLFCHISRKLHAKQRCTYSSGTLTSPEPKAGMYFITFLYVDVIYH